MGNKETLGLFAPSPNQGDDPPGPTIADVTWYSVFSWFPLLHRRTDKAGIDRAVLLARRLKAAKPGCLASGESQGIIRRGKFTFPLGFSRLSWARSPHTFRNPSAAGEGCLLIPTAQNRLLRVQGPQDPGAGLGARSPQRFLISHNTAR